MIIAELIVIAISLAFVILVAVILVPLAHWWSRIGLPKIGRTSACANCAYDLAGLPKDAACPECGSDTRPSIRLSNRSPWWVTNIWLAGTILANLLTLAFAISNGMPLASLIIAPAAYSLVLLSCFHTIARRPNKAAVIVAMVSTLGLQMLTQVFQVLLAWNHYRRMSDPDSMLLLSPILISAAGLAATSLIAILIIAITPDTDLTPPASP